MSPECSRAPRPWSAAAGEGFAEAHRLLGCQQKAAEHFARLRGGASDPRLEEWLHAASA